MGWRIRQYFGFSQDKMRTWTIDYANLNNNISISIDEDYENLIEIEKEIFEMKLSKR